MSFKTEKTSLEKARTQFEYQVGQMQAELKEYANKRGASQKAIDIRLNAINALVEYYQEVEYRADDWEWQYVNMHMHYSNLHTRAQKLVYWCQLHRISVSAIDYYSLDELEDLVRRSIDFTELAPRRFDLYFKGIEINANSLLKDEDLIYKYALVHTFFGPRRPLDFQPPKPTQAEVKEMYQRCLSNANRYPQLHA